MNDDGHYLIPISHLSYSVDQKSKKKNPDYSIKDRMKRSSVQIKIHTAFNKGSNNKNTISFSKFNPVKRKNNQLKVLVHKRHL